MPWETTDEYIRSGHRSPEDFQEGSFRTITIDADKGIKAVIGKPKGKDTTEVQSYLFDKSKDWTVEKAKAWFEAHKESKVKEHVSAILPFKVLEKIVDKPLRIRGIAMTSGMSRNFNIYTPEELQAFTQKLVSAPVYIEHVAVPNAVGKVTKTEWDGQNLWYEAEIYDDEVAEKIRKGLIQHVSVGADYETLDIVDGKIPHGLHNAELSLVAVPGIPETNVQILESLAPTGSSGIAQVPLKERENMKKNVKEQNQGQGEPKTDKERFISHFGVTEEQFETLYSILGDELFKLLPERGQKVKEQNGEGNNQDGGQNPTVDEIKAKIADLTRKREEIMAQLYPEAELTDEQRAALNAEAEAVSAEIEALEKALAELIAAQVETTLGEGYRVNLEVRLKEAEWDTEYINNLPDECFAYIEPGGEKDEEGKTKPRSLRHLPFKNAQGNIDHDHLVNALARLPQTDLSDEAKAQAKKKLCAAVKQWNSEHPDNQIVSDVCGVEPSNQQQEQLQEKIEELTARIEKLEKILVENGGNIAESLLKKTKEKAIPVTKAIEILQGLLPSPVVERSSLGMQRECQEIRRAIFQLEEMLKSG